MQSHLNDEQIDEFLRAARDVPREPPDQEIEEHLKSCEFCRERLLTHDSVFQRLRNTSSATNFKPGPDCPPQEVWLEIAVGVRRPNNGQYLEHAGRCDFCGRLLSHTVEIVARPTSGEEDRLIKDLRTSDAEWQRRFAKQLSVRSIDTAHRHRSRWWVLVAAVLLLTAGWLVRSWKRPSPEDLLATAYSENRTVELRIEGAKAGPLMVERGSAGSDISRSPTLLEAKALIGKQLTEHPEDPYWIRMKGRADILGWNYDQAIVSLNEARRLGADTPSLVTDLASAYFERAEATRNPENYGEAIELLGTVLDREPDNAVALFNRALTFERINLYSQALADWQKYLKLYPDGAWASEARRTKQRVEQLLLEKQKRSSETLADRDTLISAAHSPATEQQIDSHIEDYLSSALESWLPVAFPIKVDDSTEKKSSIKAVQLVSGIALKLHHDRFLPDLLESSEDRHFPAAVLYLSRAVWENHSGEHERALRDARGSGDEFRLAGSKAGQLRAAFEAAYASQRMFHPDQCLQNASKVFESAMKLDYRWLAAQAAIEEAFCHNESGQLELAASASKTAITISRNSQYHDTWLRAAVGMAITSWERGDTAEAWNQVDVGLRDYWSGRGSRMRGTALLEVLDAMAEDKSRGHLQSAVIREYLPSLSEQKDPVEVITSWFRLGNSELSIHRDDEAAEAFRHAREALASSPHDAATQDRNVLGIAGMARVEFERGRTEEAGRLLRSIRDEIDSVQEVFTRIDYSLSSAEVARKEGRREDARKDYQTAIRLSEDALGSVSGPQDRISWSRYFSGAYRGLVNLELEDGHVPEALQLWEWYRSISIRGRRGFQQPGKSLDVAGESHPAPVKIDFVQSHHDRERLVYAVFGPRVGVWVSGRNGLTFHWLGLSTDDLAKLAEDFSLECASPRSDPTLLAQHAAALRNALIRPVETELTSGSLLAIEPDGAIAHVPFGALLRGSDEPFALEHDIVLSPGIVLEDISRHQKRISGENALALLQSNLSGAESGELPDHQSHLEAEHVLKLFRHSVRLDCSRLTESEVQRSLANAEVIHYAGHFDPERVGSGTDPRGANPLRADQLFRTRFAHCRLAVLAGCSTGLAARDQWIDRNSLVLPILFSGVPCVIASRWPVNSETTAALMNTFYDRLLLGASVPQALHLAKEEIRQNTQTSRPYYWASFDVYGNCRN